MRDHRPQSADHLLDSDNLTGITQRAVALDKLNKKVRSCLSPELANQLRVANYRQGILVLVVASSAWAQRLNFERFHLLSSLRTTELPQLSSIEIKINPDLSLQPHRRKKSSEPDIKQEPISPVAAEYLKCIAADAPEKIKRRLERLAAMAKK
ncbi:DUF721 domain-containing protein [Thaumasiovibrio subtropicus]|uniref:DUF721 domain-containing protein n=1 Tax=Thaumasiovibrio subtropicus TaxID=1891207 RepID=UPI000B35716A|nr:DciA family protein [Thaumasiovibrio subtropicus]